MKLLKIKKADTYQVYKKYIYISDNKKILKISIKEFKKLMKNEFIKEKI